MEFYLNSFKHIHFWTNFDHESNLKEVGSIPRGCNTTWTVNSKSSFLDYNIMKPWLTFLYTTLFSLSFFKSNLNKAQKEFLTKSNLRIFFSCAKFLCKLNAKMCGFHIFSQRLLFVTSYQGYLIRFSLIIIYSWTRAGRSGNIKMKCFRIYLRKKKYGVNGLYISILIEISQSLSMISI